MLRSLTYYWRGSLAVAAGSAVAATVLTGALLVGDSLRASLRELSLARLGKVESAVASTGFVRRELARELAAELAGEVVAPVILLRGSAVHATTRARASGLQVLGVDGDFRRLYPPQAASALALERASGSIFPPALVNRALASELEVGVGDEILVHVARPSDIPRETLVGRDDDPVETLRLEVRGVLPDRGPGGFSLAAGQASPRNLFVDLADLGRALFGRGEPRANLLLTTAMPAPPSGASLTAALGERLAFADLGLAVRGGAESVVVEASSFVLTPGLAAAVERWARERRLAAQPVLTYLANELRVGDRSLPYSTIAALEPPGAASLGEWRLRDGSPAPRLGEDEILLNAWAAERLAAAPGETVEVTYYELGPRDELRETSRSFRLAGVLELTGLAADGRLTPEFPGISAAEDIRAWSPPFPVDLARIGPDDEAYWDDYSSLPKAFVALATGQRLWRSRFGDVTSIRLAPADRAEAALAELAAELDPGAVGLSILPLRRDALAAARGATDFAGLFLGLSLFLIASAALLVALLFRLGVERRAREVGLLRAIGYPARRVARRFLSEGLLLAAGGAALGTAAGLAYGWLMIVGLTTWWLPAIGEPVLRLAGRPASFAAGWLGAVAVVAVSIWWTVRRLGRSAPPRLLAGAPASEPTTASRRPWRLVAAGAGAGAGGILAVSLASGRGESALAALTVGALALVAGLATVAGAAGSRPRRANALAGLPEVAMGVRNSARNRGRSLASVALIACAVFLVVVVAANRQHGDVDVADRRSGAGGFALVAESEVPIHRDLDDPAVRGELGLDAEGALADTTIQPLRLLPGDDASCLNLFRPEKPRVLGVPPELVRRGGFSFAGTAAEVENPWTLLDRELEDGAVPAIGDYNSVVWILHSGLGKDLVLVDERGREVRLRFVALLEKSLFQSEILISERAFLQYFPSRTGYSFFLLEPGGDDAAAAGVATALESALERYGFDVTASAARLASFAAVESTYLATFQTLGGLGLVLGTLGLGVVLLRNVLERRKELATLRAFGFRRTSLARQVLAENAFLLVLGLAIGALSGLLAAAPAIAQRAAGFPFASLAATLALVLVAGLAASVLAVRRALATPLVPALKAD